ncbi:HNH endonuclease [Cryobacterium sp. TMT2-10]|uniref:HNH endonuclease n=1 Tax=Cryobacterium sp. TMT2-10 TaxID=1259244 RepID=UPI00106D4201|nr:HNH endonuclease signature motif containing protein [Cryobacterium sp. TMT2-10]TFD40527.1 HNH endonuclease [Cryobacterium sp. TMT2-10]
MSTSVGTTQKQLGLLFDAVAAADRVIARNHAVRAAAVDEARRFSEAHAAEIPLGPHSRWDRDEIARREFSSELAATLHLPEPTADNLIAESRALTENLPGTRAALEDGLISYRHAQTLIGQACSIPLPGLPAFEQALLPAAQNQTVAKLKHTARVLRERLHPETITSRRARSILERTSWLQAEPDGMATLHLNTGAELVQSIFTRANDIAVSLLGPGEQRTLTQVRTDVLSDLLINGVTPTGVGDGVRATVHVTVSVSVMTLLGHSEEPGHLEGYGPIDPDTARDLASRAPSFTRLLTHPETGVVLSVGRDRYKVPKRMRRFLRLRDETCRFPGCNKSARRAELDHTHDWHLLGQTAHDNLAHLCKANHALKSETRWQVAQTPGGILTWTSPTGRDFVTAPARVLPTGPPGTAPPLLPEDAPF